MNRHAPCGARDDGRAKSSHKVKKLLEQKKRRLHGAFLLGTEGRIVSGQITQQPQNNDNGQWKTDKP
jgi:hypothetical protein